MEFFRTKNPNLGKFWMVLQWMMLACFSPFSLFYCHLAYFVGTWEILWFFGIFSPRFGLLFQEKSGIPAVGKRFTFRTSLFQTSKYIRNFSTWANSK
jgi:hypothetical protein